jgi:hypothetical protein
LPAPRPLLPVAAAKVDGPELATTLRERPETASSSQSDGRGDAAAAAAAVPSRSVGPAKSLSTAVVERAGGDTLVLPRMLSRAKLDSLAAAVVRNATTHRTPVARVPLY